MEDQTSTLKTIPNFRDAGEFMNHAMGTRFKHGMLYRGARPDEASSVDRRKLVETFGIRNIIDLRTKTEHIQQAQNRDAKIKASSAVPQTNDDVAEPLKIPGVTYHEINFNGSSFSRMLISKLSWREFGKLVGLMAFGYRTEGIKVLAPSMIESGLVGLATQSIDVCGKEVYQFFEVLTEKDNWPILIHCTQGKDRTGLTVMLVLFLCGASVEAVEKDYLLSESELEAEMEARIKEIETIGLTEDFAKCPPDLVKKVHQHILEKYGSVEGYLKGVGVTTAMQEKVKEIMLVDAVHA